MTFIRPFRIDYGDGSDGTITLSGTVTKQVYNLGPGSQVSGLTLSGSFIPSIIRCTGPLVISGNIDGAGKGNAGGPGGRQTSGRKGRGPGGGWNYGGSHTMSGGGGGGHNGPGGNPTYGMGSLAPEGGGESYDTALASVFSGEYGLWCAGSGGGSGNGTDREEDDGGSGGAGGGGLFIYAPEVTFNGGISITLNGVQGQQMSGGGEGSGGGGSGGLLVVVARRIVLPTSGTIITAAGGPATGSYLGWGNGGAGAPGRIYLCYLDSITPSDAANRSNPLAQVVDLKGIPRILG